MKCERCGAVVGGETGDFTLPDYCATCSRNLCAPCMKKGCCGKVPAESGMGADHGEEE